MSRIGYDSELSKLENRFMLKLEEFSKVVERADRFDRKLDDFTHSTTKRFFDVEDSFTSELRKIDTSIEVKSNLIILKK
jgi:hypothetical protein